MYMCNVCVRVSERDRVCRMGTRLSAAPTSRFQNCVYACVCARVRECASVYVCTCMRVCVCARVRLQSLQSMDTRLSALQHTATNCYTLQHTATASTLADALYWAKTTSSSSVIMIAKLCMYSCTLICQLTAKCQKRPIVCIKIPQNVKR